MPNKSGYQPETRSSSSRRADFDLLRRLSDVEHELATGGGGGGTGTDEVWIGPSDPIALHPTIELWIDSDAFSSGGGAITLSYVHNQGVVSSVWIIDHNLGWYPNVTAEDSAGTTVEGEIAYDSINRVTLTFSAGFSGIAYLS